MIGIDTNILLRLWLNDDPVQNKPIDVLLAEHGSMPGSLLVTDVGLVEAVWTLKSAFGQDRHARCSRAGGKPVSQRRVKVARSMSAVLKKDQRSALRAERTMPPPSAAGNSNCPLRAPGADNVWAWTWASSDGSSICAAGSAAQAARHMLAKSGAALRRCAKRDPRPTVGEACRQRRERRFAPEQDDGTVPWVLLLKWNGAQCRQAGVTAA